MIDDQFSKFYNEGPAPQAGIKNPRTGLREETGTAYRKELRDEESHRKEEITKRIILQLMQNEYGREWIYDLLNICNVFGNPYTTDPLRTAFNCGALYIGNGLYETIRKFSIKEYSIMIEEEYDRQRRWEDLAADKK